MAAAGALAAVLDATSDIGRVKHVDLGASDAAFASSSFFFLSARASVSNLTKTVRVRHARTYLEIIVADLAIFTS